MNPYHLLTETLFTKGFGGDDRTVAQYRRGIEPIPESLIVSDSDLFLLSLADPRPGLLFSCRFLGIRFGELGHNEDEVGLFDQKFPIPKEPFWFRHDDGRKNRGRRSETCRDELVGDIHAGSCMEGIFAFAHHPAIVVENEHIIDLPRTICRGHWSICAYLMVWHGQAELHLDELTFIDQPHCGTMCLRRK